MKIHRLNLPDYISLINELKLNTIHEKALGLPTFPLNDPNNINILFQEYEQREVQFEKYLSQRALSSLKCKTIVFSEASQSGNKKYIYKGEGSNFHFRTVENSYFRNVTEVKWNESIIIDFFSPIGINHSSKPKNKTSRDQLNDLYDSNKIRYESYFNEYFNSIISLVPTFNLANVEVIIVAPKRTRDSILNYLKRVHKITKSIKCYRIDERGATSNFDWL